VIPKALVFISELGKDQKQKIVCGSSYLQQRNLHFSPFRCGKKTFVQLCVLCGLKKRSCLQHSNPKHILYSRHCMPGFYRTCLWHFLDSRRKASAFPLRELEETQLSQKV